VAGPLWQISAGELFELLRPAAWALSTLLSACVLADTQRRRLPLYAMAAWTVCTLLIPLIVLPIYLIVRFASRASDNPSTQTDAAPAQVGPTPPFSSRVWKFLLPPLYALLVLSLAAPFFYHDYRSVDAHLARANQARLMNQPERTINEYRAALRLEDNAHTHNLLAAELSGAGLYAEALAELRAAERGGEPDSTIPYRVASLLDLLERREEAAREYQNFLNTPLCTQSLPDARCENARLRAQAGQ
jgi:tetratricopeptide (TPR) repeat protein